MTTFATHADLESRWHTLSAEDQALADVLLTDAAFWLIVWFKRIADIEALALTDPLLAEGLEILSCAMVKRAMVGGDFEGAASQLDTMGRFSTQVTYRNPDGNLYLTNREFDGILGLLGGAPSGAVSMTSPGL